MGDYILRISILRGAELLPIFAVTSVNDSYLSMAYDGQSDFCAGSIYGYIGQTGTYMKGLVCRPSNGFGLLELMVALVSFSLLVTLAVPAYSGMVDRARVAGAIGDIGSLAVEIDRFSVNNNDRLPATLSELPMDIPLDPWGRPYLYLSPAEFGDGDYDIYSLGADGVTGGEDQNRDTGNWMKPTENEG